MCHFGPKGQGRSGGVRCGAGFGLRCRLWLPLRGPRLRAARRRHDVGERSGLRSSAECSSSDCSVSATGRKGAGRTSSVACSARAVPGWRSPAGRQISVGAVARGRAASASGAVRRLSRFRPLGRGQLAPRRPPPSLRPPEKEDHRQARSPTNRSNGGQSAGQPRHGRRCRRVEGWQGEPAGGVAGGVGDQHRDPVYHAAQVLGRAVVHQRRQERRMGTSGRATTQSDRSELWERTKKWRWASPGPIATRRRRLCWPIGGAKGLHYQPPWWELVPLTSRRRAGSVPPLPVILPKGTG